MGILRPQHQATVGSVTRKNNLSNRAHLEFLNQPLTMEVKNSHRTMNSTHGPFFQQKGNNLPPLSAMNKYENSTKVSDIDATLDVSLTKRAGTNMEIRTDRVMDDRLNKTTAKTKSDPFYS